MQKSVQELKEKLVEVIRVLANGDILTLMVGHVSCRIPGTDNILMLGHAHKEGRTLDTITPEDLVTINLKGEFIEGRIEAPGERFIHTGVYNKRPDVEAVVHAHPFWSGVFGVAGKEIIPVYWRAFMYDPKVPIYDYAGQIDTEEYGLKVADALGDSTAILLAGHGHVVTGRSLEEVGINCFVLEWNAQMQLYASILGNPNPVTRDEVQVRHKADDKHVPTSAWCYYVTKYGTPAK